MRLNDNFSLWRRADKWQKKIYTDSDSLKRQTNQSMRKRGAQHNMIISRTAEKNRWHACNSSVIRNKIPNKTQLLHRITPTRVRWHWKASTRGIDTDYSPGQQRLLKEVKQRRVDSMTWHGPNAFANKSSVEQWNTKTSLQKELPGRELPTTWRRLSTSCGEVRYT